MGAPSQPDATADSIRMPLIRLRRRAARSACLPDPQHDHVRGLLSDPRLAGYLAECQPAGVPLELDRVLALLHQFGRVELLALDSPEPGGRRAVYTCSLLGRGDAELDVTSAAVWPLIAALGCLRDTLSEIAARAEGAFGELDAWRARTV